MDSLRHRPTSPLRGAAKAARILVNDRRDYLVGILLLLFVVFLWTLANFATQDVFQAGYEKPFLVTWLDMSSFAVYLIPIWLKKLLGKGLDEQRRSGYERLTADPTLRSDTIDDGGDLTSCEQHLPPLTTRETLQLALICCFIWFAALWTVIASLDYTSVASSTIMSSMSGIFTLGIGRAFKVESLSVVKVVAVAISFSGVLLVSLSDSTQTVAPEGVSSTPGATSRVGRLVHDEEYSNPLLGDLLALSSAVFSAFYVILLKVKVRQESRIDMQLFFGFAGLFSILFLWPLGVVLHLTGAETFEFPSGPRIIGGLLVNMLITCSSNYIYLIAMLKTTPLVVTVGLSLAIPVAAAGDFLLGRTVKLVSLLGALLVLGSFIVVGLEDSKNEGLPAENSVAGGDQVGIRLRIPSEVEDYPPL